MSKQLVLTDNFLESYKTRKVDWGFGGLGELVYRRTYSRQKENGEQEVWWETVKRVVEGCYNAQINHCLKNGLSFNMNKGQHSAQKMYDLIFNFKFLPPGRGLEHMGAESLYVKLALCLYNCSTYTTEHIDQDFARPFTYLMDASMLGVGVSSDMRGAGKVTIKGASEKTFEYVIPDSREGWVESLKLLLESHAYGREKPIFIYTDLRPEGAPLKIFGGKSSGPTPLREMHEAIDRILSNLKGQPITSTAITDIFNWIGRCVVSGGVRRTAILLLGHPDDQEFFELKDPVKYKEELLSHRWSSNNSCLIVKGMDYERLVDQFAKNGEPGGLELSNCQNYGRFIDGYHEQIDSDVRNVNPCGEATLEGRGGVCNLVETFPSKHESKEDYLHTLKFAFLYAKSVTLIPTHNPEVNAIIGKNRRIGVSPSGITQAIRKFGFDQFANILDDGYKTIKKYDKIYSDWLCIPRSVKLTVVKPSGSVSLLAGVPPGIHYPHSEYYIRNVRLQKTSHFIPLLKRAGYKVEDSVYGDNTVVVSFPIHEEFFDRSKFDVSAIEQLELAAQIQYWWADQSVSATVTFKPEEIPAIKNVLPMYFNRLKSISFLPLENHSYKQAPYIEITQQEYEAMMKKIKPLNLSINIEKEATERYCDAESCTL